MDADKFWILYDNRYLLKTQFIFFIRYKIFSMSFRMFDTVFPKKNFCICRKNICKFRILFNDRINDILTYAPDRNKF